MDVANEPRAVTVARVSASSKLVTGQYDPSARQTAWPSIVAVAKDPLMAKRLVPDAMLNPSQLEVAFKKEALVEFSVVTVPVVAVRLVVATLVVVTLVNVAFVPVRACKLVSPSTVSVLVTVELAPMKPPYS